MASSHSSAAAAADEETADEVKVFRTSAPDDDANELAGSSAELNADKQELAMEAELESQGEIGQRFAPIANPFGPLPWPSPGSNFVFGQLLAAASLSPAYGNMMQKVATAAAATAAVQQMYTTAAILARHSPNYMNLAAAAGTGSPFGAHPFERPPAFSFSTPCTPSTAQRNGQTAAQQNSANGGMLLNSPMGALGGVLGGMSLSAGRHQQHQRHLPNGASVHRTPKRDKPERREPKGHQSREEKKEHIKKPMNAFMLFMKENRHSYLEKQADKRLQSAELNKQLGQIWQQMSRDAQQPYYEMAQKAKEEHARMHPQWSARQNYGEHKKAKKKRTREKSIDNNEQKKCRARFGVEHTEKWCKHCRRKKRCLNVRDSSSPVQVSSTTNPTTPLSLGTMPPGSSQFSSVFGIHPPHSASSSTNALDSPAHSSSTHKGGGTNTSEMSRCSSTASSSSSGSEMDGEEENDAKEGDETLMEAEEGGQRKRDKEQQQSTATNGMFKLEQATAASQQQQPFGLLPMDMPKPIPSLGLPGAASVQSPLQSAFQMNPASFQFPANFPQSPFMFGRFPNFLPN